MVDFAGWEMPQQYSTVRDEHRAVRDSAGLFDVSHMGRARVTGAAASAALQRLVTNDLERVEVGHAQYNLMCREDGGVIDDLVLYRDPDGWAVVFNAGNRDKDMAWFRRHLDGAQLIDESDQTALLALQGPRAASVLAQLSAGEVDGLAYFGHTRATVAGIPDCRVARTGYTGEDGFEIFAPAEVAPQLWAAMVAAGAVPAGLAARDVCRLEAGLRLYGNDMDETVNPYEAGLGWTVKLAKGDFVGRAALEAVKLDGPRRRLVGLRGTGRTIPRHGAALMAGDAEAGLVTSGTWSFFLDAGIGMARVTSGVVSEGDQVVIGGRAQPGSAEVVALPFYRGTAGRRSAGAADLS